MKTFIDNFTGLYPVSKTLRLEARPVPATKEWLESDQCSVLFNDVTRDEYYPVLKNLLDDYYRYYIEEALSGFRLDEDLVLDAFNFYMDKDFEKLEKILEKLRGNLVKVFDSRKDYLLGSGAFKDLVKLTVKQKKEVLDSHLVNWINNNPKYTEDERKKFFDAIGAFDGFITYLGSYKQTRDNLFSDEKIASSIAFRVIHENMLIYFANIRIFEKIKVSYPHLFNKISKFGEFFTPEGFAGLLSQSQIDRYNYNCIGRPVEDIDYKGVNILINEYRQKMDIRSNELPCMANLYKQLLSDRESFMPEGIKSEEEAIETAKLGYDAALDNIKALEELFESNIRNNYHDNMYIKVAAINDFSKTVLEDWKILGETIKKAKYKEDLISLGKLLEMNFFPVSGFYHDELEPHIGSTATSKVNELKNDLDNMLAHIQKYKPFYLFKGTKPLDVPDSGISFANEFREIYENLTEFIGVYNKVRNFATKKPYSMDKIKLNFDNPSLLAGWDLNRESTNGSYMFVKDNKYYLGIANSETRDIFVDIHNNKDASCQDGDECYYKVEYKQISGAAKTLAKVFFAEKNIERYGHLITDRVKELRAKKLYTTAANDKEALAEWIDFLKAAIAIHPEWNNFFSFKFRDSHEYANINDFYTDVDNQAYSFKLLPVSAKYIDRLTNEHKMYFFQLYNKDFSEHSHGRKNLHTMYWNGIFSKENLDAISDGTSPFIKLNGEAEMFMREASIPRKITHPKNEPIANKNPIYEQKESVYHYDLIKDKRFTERKFFFHCPITLNYRAATRGNFNVKINEFVADNPDINIIGIDRGERNLLYYTVIIQSGDILAQGSLNHISHNYTTSKGKEVKAVTDYQLLLNIKEKERNDARQAWGVIKNIKELKAGYLSQAVHEICQLMLKYNAIVVLENLDLGFKRSRAKVEKQIYQKFEKAMIDKLNYLVFKDRGYEENGSFGKGLQLAAPFESFSKIGKQTGCIYYVSPSYTSHIDPKTGFVNLLKLNYENISKAQAVLEKIDSISYNAANDYFEFAFDYKNFGVEMAKTDWVVCTCGGRRPEYSPEEKKIKNYHVTTELKALLDSQGIDYEDGKNIVSEIASVKDKSFLEGILFHLRLTLKMRYTGDAPEDDFFLSPVENTSGSFFDTREASQNEPQTADANDAYHIALKGLMAIRSIKNGKLARYKTGGEKEAWFKYMQNQEFRQA